MPRQTKAMETADAGKRHPLNMRTTKELRERLEKAAATAGRSLAQEVEFRLERSFEQEGLLSEVLERTYGARLAGLLMMMGWAMRDTGRLAAFELTRDVRGARNWADRPDAFHWAEEAAVRILEWAHPGGLAPTDRTPPPIASAAVDSVINLVDGTIEGTAEEAREVDIIRHLLDLRTRPHAENQEYTVKRPRRRNSKRQ